MIKKLTPREAVATMGPQHPVVRSVIILRFWLALMTVMLVWNGAVANGILLGGWLRPLPFLFLAVMTIVWSSFPWHPWAVIASASTLGVGLVLRGMEVWVFAGDRWALNTRFTAASVWWTVGGTSVLIGVLNLIVTSRRTAEEWVWQRRSD